jgi:hypothetical protein
MQTLNNNGGNVTIAFSEEYRRTHTITHATTFNPDTNRYDTVITSTDNNNPSDVRMVRITGARQIQDGHFNSSSLAAPVMLPDGRPMWQSPPTITSVGVLQPMSSLAQGANVNAPGVTQTQGTGSGVYTGTGLPDPAVGR